MRFISTITSAPRLFSTKAFTSAATPCRLLVVMRTIDVIISKVEALLHTFNNHNFQNGIKTVHNLRETYTYFEQAVIIASVSHHPDEGALRKEVRRFAHLQSTMLDRITAKAHLYEYTATEGLMAEALQRVSGYTTALALLLETVDPSTGTLEALRDLQIKYKSVIEMFEEYEYSGCLST